MRISRVIAGSVAVLVTLAALLILAPGRVDRGVVGRVDDLVFVILTVTAAVSCGLTARATRGRRRAAWTAMAAGMTCWALGDILWTYIEFRGWDTFPSAADVPYLIYLLAAGVALLLFPTRSSAQSPARTVLDGMIVAGSLFIVAWLVGLGQLYRDTGMGRVQLLVSLAYPLTTGALLTMAAVVLVRSDSRQRVPLTLLTIGLASSAVASGFFTYIDATARYRSGDLIDLGWAVSAMLVTAAAWIDRLPDEEVRRDVDSWDWVSAWMVYIPLVIAASVVAAAWSGEVINPPVPLVSAVLVAAVLVRQFLTDRENRRLLRTVSDQALHDPLTGLANRAYFQRRMNQLMDRTVPVAVLALDLNDFKLVNDTFGHATGDELLVAVAARIQECVRKEDTVARIGGDEFVILAVGDREYEHDIADRLMKRFAEPFSVAGQSIDIRFGLGIARADGGEQRPSSEDLLREADMAMYETKRSARGAVVNPTVTPAPAAMRLS